MHLSPLHYEIVRHDRQRQIAASIQANRVVTQPLAHQLVWSRVRKAAIALGVCLAAATGLTVTGAQASPHTTRPHVGISAAQLNPEIDALEAKGYLPAACTRDGTLLRDPHTGRLVRVRL
jgi:hypothetical protein